MNFTTLEAAREKVLALSLDARSKTLGPTPAEAFAHCAQSIECSLAEYPVMKPWVFRVTIGRIALAKFLRQGFMKHDVCAGIPGVSASDASDGEKARRRLLKAIDDFRAHEGSLAPHFAYGPVDKARYDQVHAMHIADHFSRFI